MKLQSEHYRLRVRLQQIAAAVDRHEAALARLEKERESIATALEAIQAAQRALVEMQRGRSASLHGGKLPARILEIIENAAPASVDAMGIAQLIPGADVGAVRTVLGRLAATGRIEWVERGQYRALTRRPEVVSG